MARPRNNITEEERKEKRRQQNRDAAGRCRNKKKTAIDQLKEECSLLREKLSQLMSFVEQKGVKLNREKWTVPHIYVEKPNQSDEFSSDRESPELEKRTKRRSGKKEEKKIFTCRKSQDIEISKPTCQLIPARHRQEQMQQSPIFTLSPTYHNYCPQINVFNVMSPTVPMTPQQMLIPQYTCMIPSQPKPPLNAVISALSKKEKGEEDSIFEMNQFQFQTQQYTQQPILLSDISSPAGQLRIGNFQLRDLCNTKNSGLTPVNCTNFIFRVVPPISGEPIYQSL